MATSDWRGLYTVPEQKYGEIYTNQDDYVLPENKQIYKRYSHRAYRGGDLPEPRPGLKADYGVRVSSLGMENPISGLAKAQESRKQKTQSTLQADMRFAGQNFEQLRSLAENIPANNWR